MAKNKGEGNDDRAGEPANITELPDPATLKSDEAILSAYFSACRCSYLSWPGNERERAYLESNRELFRISSYFAVRKMAWRSEGGLERNGRCKGQAAFQQTTNL